MFIVVIHSQAIYLMCFLTLYVCTHCEERVHCEEIKDVFNDNGLMCEWMEGDWNRMACWKIRSRHLQGANIIGSQKECLRASAVVNSPFVSQGPGRLCHCSELDKELDFFWLVFSPCRQLTSLAHQWPDLIRTLLSDLFTKGHWLYLWPIHFE